MDIHKRHMEAITPLHPSLQRFYHIFWLFFQYSLDLIIQIIVNCLPPVVNIANAPHGHVIAEFRVDIAAITLVTMIFRVFGLFSVFPYESWSIPRQRASTHRLYHQGGQFTSLWKALYR
jgi:hypothetical protein